MACQEGHVECAQLLLGAGAAVDLAMNIGATPLFVACQEGHVECVQLLSSHGASRVLQRETLPDVSAEGVSRAADQDAVAEWLVLSRGWSPLHHLEVLSVERTRALLRDGADLHLKPSVGAASPLERAQQLAPGNTAASIVVRAAGPWS